MTKKAVRYGIIKKASGDEFVKIDFRTLLLETKSVKRYYNITPLLAPLSKCALLLWEYSIDHMNKENIIKNDTSFKEKFNALMIASDLKPYEGNTINKAFQELAKADLVYKEKKRGDYQINPAFVYKGTEDERVKQVRKWLERPFKAPLAKKRKQLLDQMESKRDEKF